MHALPLKTPWQRILQHAHQWPSSRIAGCHFEIPSDIQILDPASLLTYQSDDQIPNTGDCKLLIRVLNKVPLHACCSARYFVSGALIDLMTYLWGQRTPTARMQVHELLVADGVMRMWSPRPQGYQWLKGVCCLRSLGDFWTWLSTRGQSTRSQTCCQVLFFTIRTPYLPWVPCPTGYLPTAWLIRWGAQPSVSLGKHHHHISVYSGL